MAYVSLGYISILTNLHVFFSYRNCIAVSYGFFYSQVQITRKLVKLYKIQKNTNKIDNKCAEVNFEGEDVAMNNQEHLLHGIFKNLADTVHFKIFT